MFSFAQHKTVAFLFQLGQKGGGGLGTPKLEKRLDIQTLCLQSEPPPGRDGLREIIPPSFYKDIKEKVL